MDGKSRRDPPPWPHVSTKHVSDHQVLKVRVDTVLNPRDQRPHPRVVIDAPDWVTILAFTPEDEALLVRQYRFGTRSVTLEAPGGMMDGEESPLEAAARELEEETGCVAERLVSLGWVHPNPALQTNRNHSFLALGCRRVHDGRPDPCEDLEVERVPRAQLARLVEQGEITHALVLACLYREQLWREQLGRAGQG